MRYFALLLWLRLKAGARSAYFMGSLVLFVGFVAVFCLLLPERAVVNLSVGLFAQGTQVSEATAQALLANGDYDFVRYKSESDLRTGVERGEVHCAYAIGSGTRPVTLYSAESSYMTPIVNEIVLAAYLAAATPELTKRIMAEAGIAPPADFAAYLNEIRATAVPMTVTLTAPNGSDWPERYAKSGMYPLLYAVLAALFVLSAMLAALLRGGRGAYRLPTGHAASGVVAPILAEVLLGLIVLLCADGVASLLYGALPYTPLARLVAFLVLAVVAAVLAIPAGLTASRPALLLLALPPLAAVWVLLSGAIVSPALLPSGLGILRLLSPPWYLLQILGALSA